MIDQVSHSVEAIKLAYLSRTPIVWLVTGDKEVASDIVKEFVSDHLGSFRTKFPVQVQPNFMPFESSSKDCTKPSIFYQWVNNDKALLHSVSENIEEYLTYYFHMEAVSAGAQAMDDTHVENIKKSIVIIASPFLPQSSWLNSYIEVIHVKPLQDREIENIILSNLSNKGIELNDKDYLTKIIVNLRGFSSRKISQTISRCVLLGYFDYNKIKWSKVLREIRIMKRQMLEGFIGIKWIDIDDDEKQNIEDLKCDNSKEAESLKVISKWLNDRKEIFEDTEKSCKNGYDIPKGVLITGIPGTGKSLMAKEAAKKLRLPLILMDMGDLQEGLVGASEQHMAEALRMVEAMAPCVLWIDEIEKAFSGSNSGTSDGGVMRRMFGKFLTWMQEKTAPCFVFATSNDISELPPELFRSERFDDKFYSFMPTADECSVIFAQLIAKENREFKKQNPHSNILIFDQELENWKSWSKFLNSEQFSPMLRFEMDGDEWKNGEMPQCKLFTGADISSLVKRVKFTLLRDVGKSINYTSTKVKETLLKELKEFMPYGQTNVIDIAKCFVKISENQFRSASEQTIISFNEYNIIKRQVKYNPNKYSGSYDRALYAVVVGAINKLSKESK